MLLEGVRLMVVGMSTVFVFLGVLVLGMHVNRWIAGFLTVAPAEGALESVPTEDDADIAVVLAAVAAARRA